MLPNTMGSPGVTLKSNFATSRVIASNPANPRMTPPSVHCMLRPMTKRRASTGAHLTPYGCRLSRFADEGARRDFTMLYRYCGRAGKMTRCPLTECGCPARAVPSRRGMVQRADFLAGSYDTVSRMSTL